MGPKCISSFRIRKTASVVAIIWLIVSVRLVWGRKFLSIRFIASNNGAVGLMTYIRKIKAITNVPSLYMWIVDAAINLLGNIVLFIPLGSFLPKLWIKSPQLWKVLLCVTGIIALVETVQVLTLLGRCDIDDLLLNLLGSAIGYGLYNQIENKRLPG